MTKRFSARFETYEEWERQAGSTAYAKQIGRLHSLHPNASLDQLRRHPKNDDDLSEDCSRSQSPRGGGTS